MTINIEDGEVYYAARGLGDHIILGMNKGHIYYDSVKKWWFFNEGNKHPIPEELEGTTIEIKRDSLISLFKEGIK